MQCSQIPTADRWDEQPDLREDYRRHLRSCLACRRRTFAQAPDALLFELRDSSLPEGFWTGFWESLEKKLPDSRVTEPVGSSYRIFRWAAVAALAAFLAVTSRNIPRNTPLVPVSQIHPLLNRVEYPVVEDVQSPKATYYIFQSDPNQKIIMVYDPDMEL
jgi:hypothetical protein